MMDLVKDGFLNPAHFFGTICLKYSRHWDSSSAFKAALKTHLSVIISRLYFSSQPCLSDVLVWVWLCVCVRACARVGVLLVLL